MKQPEALRLADLLAANWWPDAAAELRRLHRSEREGWRYADELEQERKRLHQFEIAFTKYLEKTEWVQETAKYYELGMDRADVLKQRIDRLHEVNQMLLDAITKLMDTESYWWQEVNEETIDRLKAAIAKAGEA